MSSVRDKKKKKEKKEKKYQRAHSRREKRRTERRGLAGEKDRRGGVCMRLIDNHRQVVSSEKGAVYDTSAEVSSAPRTKGRSIIGPDNPNSKLAGQFPAVARAITMEIKNNPNNLHVGVAWQFEDTKTSR